MNEKDFAWICAFPANRTFYLIEFHDYRNKDNYFTKNRVYFIDGEIVPGHMYVSNEWNIYANASRDFMKVHEWMKKVDEGFMENCAECIGEANRAALNEVHRRVGLDFLGLDFALLPDGRILLFECNPAMAYRPDYASPEDYPYKQRFAQGPVDQFSEMILSRIHG